MNLSQDGIDLIKRFEGCKLEAYKDIVGVCTIGYGFTKDVEMGMEMSQQDCDERLLEEISDYEEAVLKACKVEPTQSQFDALVCLSWNIGINGMAKSTVIRKHNEEDFQGAAAAFLMWNKAGGKEVKGLTNRRKAEAELYLS